MILLEMIAWGSSLLALIFLLLMLVGIDDVFGGMFETRIVAFFGAGLGWTSILMHEAGYSIPIALASGVLSGSFLGAIALGIVMAIRRVSAATEPASSSPVGKVAEVSIAPDDSLHGMIRLVHRGQLTEFPAVFESPITIGSPVAIIDSVAGKLRVRPVDSPKQ